MGTSLRLVGSIRSVKPTQQRSEQFPIRRFARLELTWRRRDALKHLTRNLDEWATCRLRSALDFAGTLNRPKAQQRLGDGASAGH